MLKSRDVNTSLGSADYLITSPGACSFVDPQSISSILQRKDPPSGKDLKDFERSPSDVALLALAANSGLGRFNSTRLLHSHTTAEDETL